MYLSTPLSFTGILEMVKMGQLHLLIFLALGLYTVMAQDGGRNDGEPDYDPESSFMDLRDGGRNDGEPDYDPADTRGYPYVELRNSGRNDGEPDYEPEDYLARDFDGNL